jgi:hypothetical protein
MHKPIEIQSSGDRYRARCRRRERWRKVVRFVLLSLLAIAIAILLFGRCYATWKPEYADASPEVQDWYKNAELTPEAQQRFMFKSCCAHSDVVKTKFRVNKTTNGDEWLWLDGDEWKVVPPDIIHWGETAPDGQPTLFVIGLHLPTCFYPGADGQ